MNPLTQKLNRHEVSTALLVSIVALPVSVVAFFALYHNNDLFWPVACLGVLPAIWLSVAIFTVRDLLKRRSWRQIVGVLVLVAPTVFVFPLMSSPRFWSHRLFSSHAVESLPQSNFGVAFNEKFPVCVQGESCTEKEAVTEARRNFSLAEEHGWCCLLRVTNGRRDGKGKVSAFHVVLNGEEVPVPQSGPLEMARVALKSNNDIRIQLRGTPDAYIHVAILYAKAKLP